MSARVLSLLAVCFAALALTATSASAAAISPSRYAALDRVFAAVEPLNEAGAAPTASQLARVRTACNALTTTDPLLASTRRTCTAALGFLRTSIAVKCAGKATCQKELGAVISSLRTFLVASRADNKVIDRRVRDAGCRRALRASAKDIANLEQGLRGFRLMQRGLQRGSNTEFARGEKLVGEISSSDRDARRIFRRACG